MLRIRISYQKSEPLRYTSNLDIHRIWERSLRRAHLPLAYSQGFHPQPRLNQACPLPLGMTSRAECIDIWLEEDLPLDDVKTRLAGVLQPGIELTTIEAVDLHAPTLPNQVRSASYQAVLLDLLDWTDLAARIEHLLSEEIHFSERRGKKYDLRNLLEHLSVSQVPDSPPLIFMRLSARAGAMGRPEEVLSALGLDPYAARVERTHLHFI